MQRKQLLFDPGPGCRGFLTVLLHQLKVNYFVCHRSNWLQMNFFHVLAGNLNMDWQPVDGLIAQLKYSLSRIKGILSHLQPLLSTQKVSSSEAFQSGQSDQCTAGQFPCRY